MMEGLAFQRGQKRSTAEQAIQDFSVSTQATSGSVSTDTQSGLGSPSNNSKRCKTHSIIAAAGAQAPSLSGQFPVLDYHLQQCQQTQGTFLNNALQPADSSTWSNWQLQQELQLNQADVQMADSPQLVRSNSAPELVKLTQADSGSWQQSHAAGGGSGHPVSAAVLSHKDFWLT